MSTKEIVEVNLRPLELWSLVSSIASLILAIVAIVLSILFYLMSAKSSKDLGSSSNSIKMNVDRLDELFNKMYSDTFSIVKDTVYDMRQHYYVTNPSKDKGNKTRSIIEEVIERNVEDSSIEKQEVEELVYKIIEESKEEEEKVKLVKSKEKIITYLKHNNNEATFAKLKNIYKENEFKLLWETLVELSDEGIINNPIEVEPLDPNGVEVIYLSKKIKLQN